MEAGYVTGTVRLVGVDGITLQATMTVSLNEFSNAISDTYIIDGEEVVIDFSVDEISGFVEVTGEDILVELDNFVTLSGNFGFQKSGINNDIVAVGNGITIELNAGDAASVSITGADIGLITGTSGTVVESKNGALAATINGFGSVSATSSLIRYHVFFR